jgi:hypothetical protein
MRLLLKDKYDWAKIQKLYDENHSYNDLIKIFNLGSMSPLNQASKQGLLKPRNFSEAKKVYNKSHKRRIVSQETKNKISDAIKQKVKDGKWHYSFSKTRTFLYTSKFAGTIKLLGSWELKFAEYLDSNNIKWRRPTETFRYEYHELKKGYGYYTPDFYLIDYDLWIEIKGYEHEKDRAKWKYFPHKLKILKGKELVSKYKLDIILYNKDKITP